MTPTGDVAEPAPIRLPRQLASVTHDVVIGAERDPGILTVSSTDGTGVVSVDLRAGKHGSTVGAIAEATGLGVTLGLRHGAPASLYGDMLRDMGLGILGEQHKPDDTGAVTR